jgi:glucose/arabinose dehydrogenase
MKFFLIIFGFILLSLNSTTILAAKNNCKVNDYVLTAQTGTNPAEIDLSWRTVNTTDQYEIQKSFNGVDFFTIATAQTGTTLYSDTGLYYQVRYWYRLLVRHSDGCADFSNISSAITLAELSNPYPIFQDSFDAASIQKAWTFAGGKWIQDKGTLQQLNDQVYGDIKKAVLTDQIYPNDQTITAKVQVTSWKTGGGDHVGVGLMTDKKGFGYELVFHEINTVQFVDDAVVWGQAYPYTWKLGVWYWFKLTIQNGTLFGKIWKDGEQEPTAWLFQQNGWTNRTTGSPALNGGGFKNGYSTALFDRVSVTGTVQKPQPFAIGGDASVHPSDFKITTFATGLNYPHSMQLLSDGSLLVSTSDPVPGGNYFASTGTLRRFIDSDNDGVAEGPGQIKYSGLPGALTGLVVADKLVFVTSSKQQNEAIILLRMGATLSDPYTMIGTINFTFPTSSWDHRTYATAIRPTPNGLPNQYDLFFNVGSEFNEKADQDKVKLSGLINATVNGSSVYMIRVHDLGSSVELSDLTEIGDGLRNAAGLSFDSSSGDLYIADNGIDFPTYGDEPLSADTLYKIPKDQIGTKVFNFGFPNIYVAYRTNIQVGIPSITPLGVFQPWQDFFTGYESEGPSEIALAPRDFPDGLNKGVFIGFFGRGFGGLANEENPVVFYNQQTGKYFHFINTVEPNIGHLTGILSTNNALYLSDLSSNGDLGATGAGAGKIYRIQAN